ncbi:MAG: PDZ domain-containing protein [Acidimicrobiales bacterium]
MDTTDPMLPGASQAPGTASPPDYGWPTQSATAAPPAPAPPDPADRIGGPSRRRRWPVAVAAVASVVVVAAVAGLLIRIPYDTIAPGSARRVDDLIAVKDHPTYPAAGRVLFTTVSVRDRVDVWEALAGWLDPNVDVLKEKDVTGNQPEAQFHQENVAAMADSKAAAEAVALRHLGYTELGGGAQIVSVQSGLPASASLKADDVIVAVDGTPVTGPADVRPLIQKHKTGDGIRLSIVRGTAPAADMTVTLGADGTGQPLLGVLLTTKLKLPFGVTIDSGNVEGPSAGLAYSLALLDVLTPGELTGGVKVAATGELAADGSVAPIGGVAQKVVAVERAGATMFLVPKDNYAEAKAHAGGRLRVVAIGSYDDALRALGGLPGSNAASFAQAGGGAS